MAKRPILQRDPQTAHLSRDQMRKAIPRLQRRIDELSQLNLAKLADAGDDVLSSHKDKINDTLIDIYGNNTIEYQRYCVDDLNCYSMLLSLGTTNFHARLPYIGPAVASVLSKLKSAREILEEKVGGGDAPTLNGILQAYQGLELHSEISRAASELYADGHYSSAVEAAVKALNGLVRVRSSLDIDGTALMERAFSPNNPVLKFNALARPC